MRGVTSLSRLTFGHALQTSPQHAGNRLSHAAGRVVFKTFRKHQANRISAALTGSLRRARNVIWRRRLRVNQGELTFAAAAAAPQAPSDDQTDGVSRRRGLVLCCRGNRALGRWRKWTSILRWEMMTTGVKICGIESSSSYSDSMIAHTLRAVGLKRLEKKKREKLPSALL